MVRPVFLVTVTMCAVLAAAAFGWIFFTTSAPIRCAIESRTATHLDAQALLTFRTTLRQDRRVKARLQQEVANFDELALTVPAKELTVKHPATFFTFYWAQAVMRTYPAVPLGCAHVILRDVDGTVIDRTNPHLGSI